MNLDIENKSIEELEDIYISLKKGHSLFENMKFKSLSECSENEISEFASEFVDYCFYKKSEIEILKKEVMDLSLLSNFLELYRSKLIEEIRNIKLNKIIN